MAVSVVHVTQIADAWSGTIPAVGTGNMLLLVVTAYQGTSGAWIHSMQPSVGGVVGGQLIGEQMSDLTGSEVYTAIWAIPAITSGATTVSVTLSGEATPPAAGAVGMTVYELSGQALTVNRMNVNSGSSGNPTVSTGWVDPNDTFVLAATCGYSLVQTGAGSPWTEYHTSSGYAWSGYQIITAGGQANYTYTSATAGTGNWAGVICSIGSATAPSPKLESWLAGYDITPSVGSTPGDLDVYASQAFNFLAAPPLCRAVQTVAESVTPGNWILINFDTILEARMCQMAGGNFQCTVDGWYNITCTVQAVAPVGTVMSVGFSYEINTVTSGPFVYTASAVGNSGGWAWSANQEIYLNVGDIVNIYTLQQLPGSTFNTSVSTAPPYVSSSSVEIVWISE